jgi:hypothetical protein
MPSSHIRRALIEFASDDILSWTPPWLLERAVEIGDENAAIVARPAMPSRNCSAMRRR